MIGRPCSPLTSPALAYTWRQLAHRVGLVGSDRQVTGFEDLNTPVFYGRPEQFRANKPGIIVIPTVPDAWQELLDRPPNSLDWSPAREVVPSGAKLPFAGSIPVLFWGEGYENGQKPFAERWDDGSIVFYADIIAATLFMLSRWEETVIPTRDHHDRFPATASVAYKQGFLDRPIVDEYALIMQAWLKVLVPEWTPQPRRFSVKLSHDIDFVRSASLRMLGGDLLKRRDGHKAIQTFKYLSNPKKDPYLRGIMELADLSERHGLRSAFFFMAADPGPNDDGYNLTSRIMCSTVDSLRKRGHEIGFHPSYRTVDEPDRFVIEKQRFDAMLNVTRYGGRQHVLRFRVPHTWKQWEKAGLEYDSTLGFADHDGFRCGTCIPFAPYDINDDREIDILEIPLIVMDVTLANYHNLMPDIGKERILQLARRCKGVGGTFTLLWHNSSLSGKWIPWVPVYEESIRELAHLI